MKRYFIIGTDTDCGKTYVSCALLDYFIQRDKRILALKPVASGCVERDGELVSEDALQLQRHHGNESLDICHWRFKPPISPHLAAEKYNQMISAQAILDYCNDEKFSHFDYLLVEGAGGLMAPLNGKETWLDFVSLSHIPVIMVVGMRLGCLNHALLTELALRTHQLHCVGWVANCLDKNMLELSANIATLSAKIRWPLLATIPYMGHLEGDTLLRTLD